VRAALARRGQSRGRVLSPPDDRSGRSAFWTPLFTSVHMLENAEYLQVCPTSGPSFRRLTAFHMSFRNKQIGSEDSAFSDQKASLDGPPKTSNDQFFQMFTDFE
jgi:hypothetical protein